MEVEINKQLPENGAAQPSLTSVLVQSEHVENLVKESAEELRHGRVPSESEVATELKMKLNEFRRLLSEINDLEIESLNVNVTFPDGSGEERIAQLPDQH